MQYQDEDGKKRKGHEDGPLWTAMQTFIRQVWLSLFALNRFGQNKHLCAGMRGLSTESPTGLLCLNESITNADSCLCTEQPTRSVLAPRKPRTCGSTASFVGCLDNGWYNYLANCRVFDSVTCVRVLIESISDKKRRRLA